jgi:hypothetical protein
LAYQIICKPNSTVRHIAPSLNRTLIALGFANFEDGSKPARDDPKPVYLGDVVRF